MRVDDPVAELLADAVRKHGYIDLPAQGYSMYPLIRQGDRCRFAPVVPSLLRRGDIVLFRTDEHRLVAHRLVARRRAFRPASRGGARIVETLYLFQGDANLAPDAPVRSGQLIGRLRRIRRAGRWLDANGWAFRAWGAVVLACPPLRAAIHRRARAFQLKRERRQAGVFL